MVNEIDAIEKLVGKAKSHGSGMEQYKTNGMRKVYRSDLKNFYIDFLVLLGFSNMSRVARGAIPGRKFFTCLRINTGKVPVAKQT
jgi:hypothetical protein